MRKPARILALDRALMSRSARSARSTFGREPGSPGHAPELVEIERLLENGHQTAGAEARPDNGRERLPLVGQDEADFGRPGACSLRRNRGERSCAALSEPDTEHDEWTRCLEERTRAEEGVQLFRVGGDRDLVANLAQSCAKQAPLLRLRLGNDGDLAGRANARHKGRIDVHGRTLAAVRLRSNQMPSPTSPEQLTLAVEYIGNEGSPNRANPD